MAKKNPVLYLEGAEELNNALRELGDRTTGLLLKQAAEAGAALIAEAAREKAPRDTGALAESIAAQPGRIQQGRAQFDVSWGKAEWYGGFVELGTEKMTARPFLRPAFDEKSEEAADAVGEFLRDALKDVLS